jgi:predicted TPR repeat methyltransferase
MLSHRLSASVMENLMSTQLENAVHFHRQGQLEEAQRMYQQILREEPENPDALHFLGLIHHQTGHTEMAIELIRSAIGIQPEYLPALQNLGNIYQESGHPMEALECYQRVIELNPSDANVYSNMSVVLKNIGLIEDAIEAGTIASNLDPENKLAWLSLANAQKRAKRNKDAIASFQSAVNLDGKFFAAQSGLCHCIYVRESSSDGNEELPETHAAYQRWLNEDPGNPVAEYMLAACTGDADIKRAPDGFITGLFDDFARSFDQNLADLDYRVPEMVAALVKKVMPSPAEQFDILDAGCGTGLLAADLKPWARRLTGVDLSGGMLDEARKKSLYDRLEEAELTAFLKGKHAAYDLLICADTLCYFGDLEEIIPAMAETMRDDAVLICSFECDEDESGNYRLNPHGRYSHREEYVTSCFETANLAIEQLHHEDLRKERGRAVAGLLYVIRKAAA